MATNIELVQQLYVAYFNRPGDVGGVNFYTSVLEANPANYDAIAADFAKSAEYQAQFAGKQAEEVIDIVYMNMFGRHAEKAALDFYGPLIQNGTITIDKVVLDIVKGAQGTDAVAYESKVTAAVEFTEFLDTAGNEAARIAYLSGKGDVLEIARDYLSGVTDAATLATAVAGLETTGGELIAGANPGETKALTAGVDTLNGTVGNDIFNGTIDVDSATGNNFTALDSIDGKDGNFDTLNLNVIDGTAGAGSDLTAIPAVTLANVEVVNIRSAANMDIDVSSWTVNTLNVTQALDVNLDASEETALNVSGATGDVDLTGGASQVISASGGNVTSADSVGNVTVSLAAAAANTVSVDGGEAVTVSTTGVTTGTITIGANSEPAGAVKVSATGANYTGAGASLQMGTIAVTGGTSIEVTQKAYGSTTAAATDITAVTTRTQGAVNADGAGTATTVTILQDATVAAKDAVAAVTGIKEQATYTFGVLLQGQTMTVGGLVFTASKDLTGAEVATAFANLAASAVQGAGKVANGQYNGTFAADWTSGAASGATVTFTAKTAATAAASALSPTTAQGSGSATLVQPTAGATVAGLTAVDAVTGVAGVAGGAVAITDSGTTDKVATVKLSGHGNSTIASEALTKLDISNSTGTLAITQTTQKTLDLTVNGLAAGATVNNATYETINMHVAGASTFGLVASGAKSLVVDGSATANIATGTTFGALETVKVTGTAGLNMNSTGSGTLKSVDTTGTTGTVTVGIDGTKATYTGGAGVDNVTLDASASITKAVSLGGGDDTLTFTGTNVPTATGTIDGGAGTNTLILAAADAATLSSNSSFEATINNFQKVSIGAVASGASKTVDLSNLDDISYVISANGGVGTAEVQTFTVTAGTGAAVAEVQTSVITAGTSAAVAEAQTFTVTGATGAGTATVGGVNVVIAGTETQDQVGAAIVGQKAAIIAANPTIADVTYVGGVVTITYTTAAGNVAALGGMNADNGNTGITFGAVVDNAVAFDSNAGNMTFAGVNVALTAGMTVDAVGAAIAAQKAAIIAANPTIADVTYTAGTDTITVTYTTGAGDVANVAIVDAATTGATFAAVAEGTKGDTNAGNMTVGGVNVALTAGMTVDQVGAAIAAAQAAIVAGNPTVSTVTYNSTTDTVSVTYTTGAGDVGNIAVVDGAATGATFGAVAEATKGVGPVGGIALTIDKMANNGTIELTAAGTGATVTMTDATGTSDVLNAKITNVGSINVGTIAAAGVETINLALDDTSTSASAITAVHSVILSDTALKSVVLTGDAGVNLTTTSNVVTSIDGSALTLALTAGSLTTATAAVTIKGGAGNDVLTANHTGDVLIGGAGADTLKIGGAGAVYANGVTLTGGAGNDIFDISGAQAVATVNDYATITDFTKGDVLKLEAGNNFFKAAVVTTGGTAVFQDLVNKFILESNDNDTGWFQYNGDTYIVEHRSADASTSFVNGTDNIVKITGLVDLSNVTSFSSSADTLLVF